MMNAEPPPIAKRTVRILVADDHRIIRQRLVELLAEHSRLEVVGEAATGRQALELARIHKPDVILMDVTMPEMNGIEATRAIHSELPAIKIIGLSMHEESDVAAAMGEAGAIDYMSKDQPAESLIQAILKATLNPPSDE